MAGKTHRAWGDGSVLHAATRDYRVAGETDTGGTPTDKPFSHATFNNAYPRTVTGSTALALSDAGTVIKLSGGSATITGTVAGSALDGLLLTLINQTGSDWVFPSLTGATLTQGPTNGDTKVKKDALCTVLIFGTEVYWVPTESAA